MPKILFIFLFFISLIAEVNGAGSSTSESTSNLYDKGANLIKTAKKLEKKGKIEKAKKRYERALKHLKKSNEKYPNVPDTLNYLGFALRKLGDFKNAEKYYLEGLAISPKHNGINEYLGELYIQTNRIELARERLEVLKNCNCEEYNELKELLENN
tara:strand:+ start:617 stop:1084 length:468 start_codon:yes stop_codon:yes gene_type:complete